MACVSMAGMHAVARVPSRVACTRRPFETTRVSLDDAREPSALAGFILFTSSQTARASAHRAVHLDRPGTKARACSPRHANAQTLGDGTEQRVYTFGSRSRSQSICSPQGVAPVCSECETTETSRWYANRDDKDIPACGVCYNRQLAASKGKCSGCGKDGANSSEMRKSKRNNDEWSWTSPRPRGRTCVTCGTDTTDTWYRCKDEPGTKICVPCYDKNRRNNTKAASANEK